MKPGHELTCHCSHCQDDAGELIREGGDRRGFLRKLGALGAGLTLGSGGPLLASGAGSDDPERQLQELAENKAVRSGKARHVTILHTGDIHAQLNIHDEFFVEDGKEVFKKRGGFASLKTMLHRLKSKNPQGTLLIDGGDCFQGSAVAALSEGKAIIPLINDIGYDIMLPGNWEVVYGKEMMMRDVFGYNSDKICANMFHDHGDKNACDLIFQPYVVKQIAGIKVGFIGYNDPLTPKRQSPAYSAGIIFTKPEENVQHYVRLLREYEGCQMVFLVTHMGLAQQVGLANMPVVEGVDYILGADTHERVRTPIQGKHAKVTEPGAFASFVSRLDLVVENGKVVDQTYQLLDVDPLVYPEDKIMKRKVEEARAPYKEKLDQVIGSSKTTLMRYYVIETPMDNLITDALMWKFKPDIALSNGFRFCPPLVPDPKTGIAEITREYLYSMLPVDSEAKMGKITGKQLWDWMEKELHNAFAKDPAKRFGGWVVRFNGMQVNFTIGNEMGKRVNSISVQGVPVQMDRMYTFVACEREGDPDTTICRVEGVSEPHRLGATLHTVMEEYLAKFSPVSPRLEGRAVATDAPQKLLTQLMGVGYEFR